MMTAAATGLATGFANAEDIAVSLVHPKGRIDIQVSAVGRVDASAKIAFRTTETGEVHEYPNPHVDVCYAKDDCQRFADDLLRELANAFLNA